jgi:hypothetical protein
MSEASAIPGRVEDERFIGWFRPAGWQIEAIATCRGCRQAISWARTRSGRLSPLDRDGISHFATCPEAERFRHKGDRS